MLRLSRSSLSAFCCLIFVGSAFSVLDNGKEQSFLPKRQGEKIDDLNRRQEIARDYISTLDKVKESWIDPYQMINIQTYESLKKRGDIYTTTSVDEETSSDATTSATSSDATNDDKVSQSDDTVNHQVLPIEHHVVADETLPSSQASIYFSRWVKKLLLLIEKENIDESSMISFSLNEEILSRLKEMSNDKTLEISQVDEVFTNSLSNAIIYKKKIFEWTDLLDYTKYLVWMIAAGSVIIFILYLFYTSSINHPYFTTLFLFLALAVFWHWMHLFQQRVAFKQAELSSMNIPNECRKHDFGFFEHIQEYFKSYFKSNGCVKYHEALSVDPMWEVSITVAISEAIAAFLLQPLSTGAQILNKSLKHLFDELTWEVKIFLFVVILLIFVMRCNYRIKLPYFMAVIEPSHQPVGSGIQNVQPTKSLTESSKEKVIKVINYFQGEDEKPIKKVKYELVTYSTDESIENIQSSKPVQRILGPSNIQTCACTGKIQSIEKRGSMTKVKSETETSVCGNIQREICDDYLKNPVDNSEKVSNTCLECDNPETESCKCSNTTKLVDSTVSS